jgi:hypothetical protein
MLYRQQMADRRIAPENRSLPPEARLENKDKMNSFFESHKFNKNKSEHSTEKTSANSSARKDPAPKKYTAPTLKWVKIGYNWKQVYRK